MKKEIEDYSEEEISMKLTYLWANRPEAIVNWISELPEKQKAEIADIALEFSQ